MEGTRLFVLAVVGKIRWAGQSSLQSRWSWYFNARSPANQNVASHQNENEVSGKAANSDVASIVQKVGLKSSLSIARIEAFGQISSSFSGQKSCIQVLKLIALIDTDCVCKVPWESTSSCENVIIASCDSSCFPVT